MYSRLKHIGLRFPHMTCRTVSLFTLINMIMLSVIGMETGKQFTNAVYSIFQLTRLNEHYS